MNWTAKPPTEPGLYWVRYKDGTQPPVVAEVFRNARQFGKLYVRQPGTTFFSYPLLERSSVLWGPLIEAPG